MCLGTNVYGHNRVWAQSCVGTIVSGHKRVWAQTCLGTIVSGHNRVWAQSCLGTIVWAQSCGLKYVWAQSCGLRFIYTLRHKTTRSCVCYNFFIFRLISLNFSHKFLHTYSFILSILKHNWKIRLFRVVDPLKLWKIILAYYETWLVVCTYN